MSVEDTVRQILVDDVYLDVEPDRIGADDGLLDVLGLDSLGFVELRARCEAVFGVRISDADFQPAHFHSVRSVAELIRTLR
nr:acyl carrier protein [uncultured Actinoplanes sp.]